MRWSAAAAMSTSLVKTCQSASGPEAADLSGRLGDRGASAPGNTSRSAHRWERLQSPKIGHSQRRDQNRQERHDRTRSACPGLDPGSDGLEPGRPPVEVVPMRRSERHPYRGQPLAGPAVTLSLLRQAQKRERRSSEAVLHEPFRL